MDRNQLLHGGGEGIRISSSGVVVRASGVRWTPTSEQIRILRELYYGCGIRSPNAEQIQRIAARLRQHGRIEGKNVFYWFQNHKARERQKKRLTTASTPAIDHQPPPTTLPLFPTADHHHQSDVVHGGSYQLHSNNNNFQDTVQQHHHHHHQQHSFCSNQEDAGGTSLELTLRHGSPHPAAARYYM